MKTRWEETIKPCPCRACVRRHNYRRAIKEPLPEISAEACECPVCVNVRISKAKWEKNNPRARAGWQRDYRSRRKTAGKNTHPERETEMPDLTPEEDAELDRKALAKWDPEWGIRA